MDTRLAKQVAKQSRLVAVHKLGQRAAVVVAATCNICIFLLICYKWQAANSMQHATGSRQQAAAASQVKQVPFWSLVGSLIGK